MSDYGFTSAFATQLERFLEFKHAMGFYGKSRIWYLKKILCCVDTLSTLNVMTLCTRDVTTLGTLLGDDFSGDVSSTLCTVFGRDDEGYGYSFITGSTPENYCF